MSLSLFLTGSRTCLHHDLINKFDSYQLLETFELHLKVAISPSAGCCFHLKTKTPLNCVRFMDCHKLHGDVLHKQVICRFVVADDAGS